MNLSAVGAHCKTSENVVGICNLVPCLDRQSLVNRIIVLPADKSFVSILGNYPFIFGALYPFLVFIRFIRISQSNGPARINRIEKNSFNGCFEPIVGIFRIRSTVFKTVSDVIISLWNGEIHTPHFCCDLTAAASLDSHAIHHFHIIRTVTRNQLCLVIGIFHISVGSYSRKTVTTLSFHFHNGTYFLGTILCIPFIDDILERSKIVIPIITVNGIIDSNKANIIVGKKHFRIKACLQILSAETGEVFHDNSTDFSVLNRFNKSFEIGTVKVCACIAVINKKFGIVITVVVGIFQKKLLLVLYAHAVAVKKIVLTEPAIKGCDFFLLF